VDSELNSKCNIHGSVGKTLTIKYSILDGIGKKISKKYTDDLQGRISLVTGLSSFVLTVGLNLLPFPHSMIFAIVTGLYGLVSMPFFGKRQN